MSWSKNLGSGDHNIPSDALLLTYSDGLLEELFRKCIHHDGLAERRSNATAAKLLY